MPIFQRVIVPPSDKHVRVHRLTAARVAESLGYQPADVVPVDIACELERRGPHVPKKWLAHADIVVAYLTSHPEHRFPEREKALVQDSPLYPGIQAAIMAMRWPESFYMHQLQDSASAGTLQLMRASRAAIATVIWALGYEKWINPTDQRGLWYFNGRQQPRYRLRSAQLL